MTAYTIAQLAQAAEAANAPEAYARNSVHSEGVVSGMACFLLRNDDILREYDNGNKYCFKIAHVARDLSWFSAEDNFGKTAFIARLQDDPDKPDYGEYLRCLDFNNYMPGYPDGCTNYLDGWRSPDKNDKVEAPFYRIVHLACCHASRYSVAEDIDF